MKCYLPTCNECGLVKLKANKQVIKVCPVHVENFRKAGWKDV